MSASILATAATYAASSRPGPAVSAGAFLSALILSLIGPQSSKRWLLIASCSSASKLAILSPPAAVFEATERAGTARAGTAGALAGTRGETGVLPRAGGTSGVRAGASAARGGTSGVRAGNIGASEREGTAGAREGVLAGTRVGTLGADEVTEMGEGSASAPSSRMGILLFLLPWVYSLGHPVHAGTGPGLEKANRDSPLDSSSPPVIGSADLIGVRAGVRAGASKGVRAGVRAGTVGAIRGADPSIAGPNSSGSADRIGVRAGTVGVRAGTVGAERASSFSSEVDSIVRAGVLDGIEGTRAGTEGATRGASVFSSSADRRGTRLGTIGVRAGTTGAVRGAVAGVSGVDLAGIVGGTRGAPPMAGGTRGAPPGTPPGTRRGGGTDMVVRPLTRY